MSIRGRAGGHGIDPADKSFTTALESMLQNFR